MESNFEKIPEAIQEHIRRIVPESEQVNREAYMEAVAGGWLEKMDHFEKETELVEMEQSDVFEKDNPNGALLLTYSGSLIKIGPAGEQGRRVEYSSIGLRTDVPENVENENSELREDVEVDLPAAFSNGPIKKSSPIYAIAVMKDEVVLEEQEEKLAEVTQILSDNFLEVNKTIILDGEPEESMSLV